MSPYVAAIEEALGVQLESEGKAVGGGCINEAKIFRARDGQEFFVKTNHAAKLPMFEAERDALKELEAASAIRVPKFMALGTVENQAFLVLEAITMQSRGDGEEMGRQLAELHRKTAANGQFGWHRDNVIGETPQANGWMDDWAEFYRERRLGFQFELAKEKGRSFQHADRLLESVPKLLSGYEPEPSLLHGDLWGGNAAFDENGQPVIFDPATYYGDRETDLAFTEMFGGFSRDFYTAYQQAWSLDSGYEKRKQLYNLYHVLNHFNLFGGGYASQAEGIIDSLLR